MQEKEIWKKLKEIFYTLFFNNFSKNSPALINKILEDRIYAEGTLWSSRKQMSKLKEDKKMFRVESYFHYSKSIVCCKWQQQACSTSGNKCWWHCLVSNVMKRTKGSAPKASVSWPNTIMFYSNDMCGVDVMNKKTAAYRLDCKIK